MKFSAREDIEAPIEFVFSQICDVAPLERAAMRRGAELERLDQGGAIGLGSAWRLAFSFRGKKRNVAARVTGFDTPHEIVIGSESAGIDGITKVELVPLSTRRTRIVFGQELKSNTLAARLLLQSLKLAKGQLEARLKKRLKTYASDIEGRFVG